ncbi:hypothetical protein OAO87_04095 [bacterium]|nr:hypothetical protein [bacterium]
MTELKTGLCNWTRGFGGELFFGAVKEGAAAGSGMHAAAMGNFFRQLAGERNWTFRIHKSRGGD